MKTDLLRFVLAAVLSTSSPMLFAQGRGGPQGPQVISPEVKEGNVTFRILAAKAQSVKLSGGDMPGVGQGKDLVKGTNDVWEVTVENVKPGYYRYNFNVDGVAVIDPRNPATSESNNNTWSLVGVPCAEFMEAQQVP